MLKYIVVEGLQYEGETVEQMTARETARLSHNAKVDRLVARNRLPMAAYREWAARHGLFLPFAQDAGLNAYARRRHT